jgi:tetratricopeptide (TPR) repeat protein
LAAAAAAPLDAATQRRAGSALIDAALEGDMGLAADAERYLERALELDPHDLTAARKLARLLNLRLVRGDFSRADRQLALFDLLRRESKDSYDRFVFDCFHRMAQAASLRDRGRPLAALHEVRSLERQLRDRLAHDPAEIETAAMAGNYALAFAGSLPVGRQRRLDDAVDYFVAQQHGWSEQSVTARGLGTAPGTRTVFAFWLAQAELARGNESGASAALAIVRRESERGDSTVPMRQLGELASLERMKSTLGITPRELLPAWPSAEQSCIACHSQGTALPEPSVSQRQQSLVP